MIAYLHGLLAYKGPTSCIIDVNGVGYELGMSTSSLSQLGAIGDDVSVFTYLQVKDDAVTLFGFSSENEKAMFEKLVSVSGVGPKLALSALSAFDADDLAFLIATEDAKRISTVPGLGKKTAERLVVELKGSFKNADLGRSGAVPAQVSPEGQLSAASEALYAMGFTSAEVDLAFKGYDGDLSDTSALIRYGLKRLGA